MAEFWNRTFHLNISTRIPGFQRSMKDINAGPSISTLNSVMEIFP